MKLLDMLKGYETSLMVHDTRQNEHRNHRIEFRRSRFMKNYRARLGPTWMEMEKKNNPPAATNVAMTFVPVLSNVYFHKKNSNEIPKTLQTIKINFLEKFFLRTNGTMRNRYVLREDKKVQQCFIPLNCFLQFVHLAVVMNSSETFYKVF